jgi:hypothetical protein
LVKAADLTKDIIFGMHRGYRAGVCEHCPVLSAHQVNGQAGLEFWIRHYARDIYPGFSKHAHHRDTESIRADLAGEGDAQAKIRCPWATMAEEPPRVNTASFTSFSACPNSGVTSP